jgi:hypothetical protein
MSASAAMQRETIRLAATILVAVLAIRLRLRCAARDERRQAGAFIAGLALLDARLGLLFALFARLIIVARHKGLRILRHIRLWLARAEGLPEGLAVLVTILELLVRAGLELLIVATLGTRLEIRILLTELLLRGCDETEVMFGMLEIIFSRNRIPGRLGIARELEVFLGHVIGRPANLHIRAVRLVNARERVLIAPVVVLLIIAPAHTLVVVMMLLTVSHGLLFNDS